MILLQCYLFDISKSYLEWFFSFASCGRIVPTFARSMARCLSETSVVRDFKEHANMFLFNFLRMVCFKLVLVLAVKYEGFLWRASLKRNKDFVVVRKI